MGLLDRGPNLAVPGLGAELHEAPSLEVVRVGLGGVATAGTEIGQAIPDLLAEGAGVDRGVAAKIAAEAVLFGLQDRKVVSAKPNLPRPTDKTVPGTVGDPTVAGPREAAWGKKTTYQIDEGGKVPKIVSHKGKSGVDPATQKVARTRIIVNDKGRTERVFVDKNGKIIK
ncbi:MAG TPA: hypothetical protein VLF69_01865 [Candidatus Saccharimonadales bacterium]|nr:hypothetical protein [Candidatus Saccharimonadales bacterium]